MNRVILYIVRIGLVRSILLGLFRCKIIRKREIKMERVFNDIIVPEYDVPMGKGVLHIMTGKFRRWWSNRWKHRLCYPDSLLSGFVYGVWAKVLKPAHFVH